MPPALAAETDQSEALGRVINADVLDLDLANAGTSQSGFPSDAGPNSQPLNLDAIGGNVELDLGSLTLPLLGTAEDRGLLDLGEAGVLSSYTESLDATTSTASAGAIGDGGGLDLDGIENGTYGSANVDLTDLLAQAGVDGLTDDIVDELSLQLGALGSTAIADGDDVTSEYVVADGQLVISSPLVGDLSTELNSALTDVGTVLNGAVGDEGVLGAVASGVSIDENVLGLVGVKAGGGTIGLTGVDAALKDASTSLLAEPLEDSNGLVEIDLANGTIAVDLQALGGPDGLNGLPANTELLDSETIGLITGAVTEALGTVTTKAGEVVVDDVLNTVGLKIEIPAKITNPLTGITLASVGIVVDTTVGQLAGTADGDPTVSIDGTLVGISLDQLLGFLNPLLDTILITPLQGVAEGLVATATTGVTDTLDGVIQPVLDTLSPVLSGVLTQVVSVTINEQPEPGYLGEDSFTVNALSLELLPNLDAVNVDLASSTVRVSDVVAEEPTLSVDPGTVNDGDTTEVTGENYPPNTDVDVQLVDPDGNPVGDPVTVTTDENGGFTAELPVPEGSDAGDYTVEGTATTGETATADLGVTNADDPTDDNTAENTEVNTAVNTDDNAAENTDTNTEVNTEVNTDVNTADNGDDNTAENTDVNTDDNTDVNTDDNTAVNTDVNTDDNAAENTDTNTE
ncbi:choice-of-anchor G family protein, partial [Brachybacterium alimentarium]|uniref:choice-of-anchor G family protein n=1 Tax=Brachybacterium alimentarium TaxID=47845 RepID=UPI003FD1A743